MNYLQVGDVILVPSYAGHDEYDHRALDVFKRTFSASQVFQVESTAIAKQGGVLNCISWED